MRISPAFGSDSPSSRWMARICSRRKKSRWVLEMEVATSVWIFELSVSTSCSRWSMGGIFRVQRRDLNLLRERRGELDDLLELALRVPHHGGELHGVFRQVLQQL